MSLKISITFIFAFMTFHYAMAQPYTSRDGRFKVDQVKGCAPLTVNVSIVAPNVCSPGVPCEFFYEGTPIQNVFTYQYTTPGTYTLQVLFQGGIPIDPITITVLPDILPAFDIYSCGGNAVQVKIQDNNYNQYVINYNDGNPLVVVPSGSLAKDNHTFASSGNKTITVRGRNLGADDNCTPSNKVVNAVNSLPAPTITQLTVLNSKDIQLDFNIQPNILYKLQIAPNSAASFQNLSDVYEISTTTINNLRTDDNFYCFRLGAFDPCNNITVYSNTICSSNFDLSVQDNVNRLTWMTSSAGVTSYSISKNNGPPLNAAAAATSLNDANVICGVNYCYQQTASYANGSKSISLSKCGTAFSTNIPTVVENISTIVGADATVELRWTQDPGYVAGKYGVTKSINGSFSSTDSSATTSFIDDRYGSDVTSCYKIAYADACNNKSPASAETCPLQLSGSLQDNNAINLSWNAYSGWKNGVDHYVVEKFDAQGKLVSSVNTGSATYLDNTKDLLNQVYLFRITAIANEVGIVPSVSNTITIIKDPNLFYPTAFTPNGDGLNDIFNVFGQFVTTFEMRIFNRWGEMMYVTNEINQGWNGMYKGSLMPEGTYVFRAKITDLAGRTFDRSGTVVLLRRD